MLLKVNLMYKFFQKKIQEPTDELVRLAEENRRLTLHEGDCHLSPEDGCEICNEMLEERGDDNFEDEKINATQ